MLRKLVLFFALFLVVSGANAETYKDTIAAVVNAKIISNRDVLNRMRLIMSSAGLPMTPDVMAKVRPQVLSMLVEERIKTDEAERLKINLDETDVDQAIGTIASQNKMTAARFSTMLQSRGISVQSLRDQIRGQLLWARLVGRQIKPQVIISDRDVESELERLKARIGQTEYQLFEIVLPSDTAADRAKSQALAPRLLADLRKDPGRFPALAGQFSRAASASQGGLLGWVGEGQMDQEMLALVRGASARSILGPLQTSSGLKILGVRDKRVQTAENLPKREEVQNRLMLERLDQLQRRYFLDLKSSSFIDERGQKNG